MPKEDSAGSAALIGGQTGAEESPQNSTASSSTSDNMSPELKKALAAANELETMQQQAFDYIDKWRP